VMNYVVAFTVSVIIFSIVFLPVPPPLRSTLFPYTTLFRSGFETYDNFEAILNDEVVEGILIATPNDSHKELAITAMRAGKHVLCEKPVAMNVEELDEILAVAKETGKTFMVHQNRRWDPDFLMVRNMYQQKPIGEVFQIESRVQGANGIPGDWRHLKEHGG